MNTIVFACLHNAGRSQMAAALFNQLADPAKAHAISAGTTPGEHVHPGVVEVMREVGVDLSDAKPQLLTTELVAGASHLVTMGCGEECPYLPGVQVIDWSLEDPKDKPIDRVRQIRNEVCRLVTALTRSNSWTLSKKT